jgi:DNA-binding transcriptional ArsR family regulator
MWLWLPIGFLLWSGPVGRLQQDNERSSTKSTARETTFVSRHVSGVSTQAERPGEGAIEPPCSADGDDPPMPKRAARGIELLADPTRRAIIALVAVRPLRPTTIAREIGLSRPAVSRQLRLLRENGLVERQRSWADRRAFIYRIPRGRHGVITAWLAGIEIGLTAVEVDDRGLPRPG